MKAEKDPWKLHAYQRWMEEGEDAETLIEFNAGKNKKRETRFSK